MPAGVQPGQAYRMSDVDLATRLSFFLWASAPDEELIEVAVSGQLSEPSILDQQVERMLKDVRSETLATRFAHQWLRLQDVGRVWPERFLYPDFSKQLANAMVRETELSLPVLGPGGPEPARVLQRRLHLPSTSVWLGTTESKGSREMNSVWCATRTTSAAESSATGVLLLLTSMSIRTSPVLRGKWVMEVLMGAPPPPPPNVPAFEATPGRRRWTPPDYPRADGGAQRRPGV